MIDVLAVNGHVICSGHHERRFGKRRHRFYDFGLGLIDFLALHVSSGVLLGSGFALAVVIVATMTSIV